MNVEKCGNCKFYNIELETRNASETDEPLHEGDYEAECRRYPPVKGDDFYHGSLANADYVARDCYAFPIVNTGNWCGEWKGK